MSKTIEVYPRIDNVPTFGDLIDKASQFMTSYFQNYKIDQQVEISVEIQTLNPSYTTSVDYDSPVKVPSGKYAWFSFAPNSGGTDMRFRTIGDESRQSWADILTTIGRYALRRQLIESCLSRGYYWEFRRSAGQPAIVTIGYGCLAAALQSLTDGFIASFDGAWDEQRFPATSDEFLSWYFHPEKAIDPEFKDWAERTLGRLRDFDSGTTRSN